MWPFSKLRRKTVWRVEKLWVDPLENSNAYGWHSIGIVTTKSAKDAIESIPWILKSSEPYPLNNCYEYEGDSVPKYRCVPMEVVNHMSEVDLHALDIRINYKILLDSYCYDRNGYKKGGGTK